MLKDVKRCSRVCDDKGETLSKKVRDLEELPTRERMRPYSVDICHGRSSGEWGITYRWLDSQVGKKLLLSKIPEPCKTIVKQIIERDTKMLKEYGTDRFGGDSFYLDKNNILRKVVGIFRKHRNRKYRDEIVTHDEKRYVKVDDFWYKISNEREGYYVDRKTGLLRHGTIFDKRQVNGKLQKELETKFGHIPIKPW